MDGTLEKKNRLQYLNDIAKNYLMQYYNFINQQGTPVDRMGFMIQHMQPGVAAGNLKAVMNTGDARNIKKPPLKSKAPPTGGVEGSAWQEWPELMDIRRKRIQQQVDELFNYLTRTNGEIPTKKIPDKIQVLGPEPGVVNSAAAAGATQLMTENDYERAKMVRDALMLKYMLGGEFNPIKTPPSGGP